MPIEVAQTWDDNRLRAERLAHLQATMREHGLGAMYLYDGINVRYVLGVYIPGGAAFVPVEGEAIALVRPRDLGYVKLKFPNTELTPYNSGDTRYADAEAAPKRFADAVVDFMAKHGLTGQPLAVDHLDVSAILALHNRGISLVNVLPLIERARAVKTNDEVAIYRAIGEQYAHTVRRFRDAIRPGISENELASVVTAAWAEAGGEDIAQLNICAGENMNPWRRWATQRPLKEGEFVGIDLHGRGFHGMRGDASRTFLVGETPTAEQKDLYKRAYDYLLGTVDIVRAGKSLQEIREQTPKVPEKYQAQLDHYNIIHGVGMNHSGDPKVDRHKKIRDEVLLPNHVLAVECYLGEEGSPMAVKLEEDIVVRDGPPERLCINVPFDERLLA